MAELTPKQEKFCQLYVQLGNASEAYRQAYNSAAKPESVNVMACNLLAEVNITLRVDEIREALKANHGITLKDILDELEEARALALESSQSSAAVAASMGKAKLLGFDKQVIDHKSSDGSMTPKGFSQADYMAAQSAIADKLNGMD